jgi:hypothetical protein
VTRRSLVDLGWEALKQQHPDIVELLKRGEGAEELSSACDLGRGSYRRTARLGLGAEPRPSLEYNPLTVVRSLKGNRPEHILVADH